MAEVKNAMIEFHPGLILILGGIIAALVPNRIRRGVMVGAPLLAIIASLSLEAGTQWVYPFINGIDLIILKADPLSLVFALIFSILSLVGCIYALHINRAGETLAAMVYAGSSLSVVLAGDWLTLIIFWEVMAVSSVFLVWIRKTPQALKAGFRYIMVHMLGGNLLLAGIFLKVSEGQIVITSLTGTNGWAFWLIFLGIAINAAIPPLHAWLPDAYPEATITGSVFMSSLTTKVAIYCLIRVFPGMQLLLWAGIIMAIYGVVFAILENDIRRLLSYHIISQVGIMVTGAGIGTELALNGATALAYTHIIYKSLLFMCVGAVIYATGRSKLTELGGFYRTMPLTAICLSIGALAISGVPPFCGFISKPMVISAAVVSELPAAELLLNFVSIGTFFSIALKLNYYIFFGADRGIKTEKPPFNMRIAMVAGSFLCVLYGLFPHLLYERLPFMTNYEPYTLDHVVSTLQLSIAVLAVFWLVLPKMTPHNTISLDTDWFYRKPFAALVWGVVKLVCKIRDGFGVQGKAALTAAVPLFKNPLKWAAQTVEGSAPAVYNEDKYRFPIGTAVLMSIIVFVVAASYILIY